MRIETLNIFFSIAETGSISQTARKHYISQPAVTSQLQALEEELSKKLFTRNAGQRKPLVLTEAGEVFKGYAKKLLDTYQEMESALSRLDANFGGLVVGTGPTIGTYIFPFLVESFRKDYPHIPVSTRMVLGSALHRGLYEREFDMIITSNLPKGEDYVSHAILDDQLVLIASAGYKVDGVITVNRLKRIPLVIREDDSSVNGRLNKHLAKHGLSLKDFNVVRQVLGNEALKQAVNAGTGLGFVARSSLLGRNSGNNYRVIQVKGLQVERHIFLIYPASRPVTASMECFTKFVLFKRWLEGTPLAQPLA